LQKKEDNALGSLREQISSESSSPTSADVGSESKASRLPQLPPPADAAAKEESRQAHSTAKVFSELEKLRKGLDERKKVREMPRDVERAREELVGCLRTNDRWPLDCWREVEAFKASVSKMEEDFIERVL
jgi:MICOS complex subunit MIC19